MKKIAILSIIFFFLPQISRAEEYSLKLRTSYNPGYLRIVLEGNEEIINKAMVNQKGPNVLVTFSGINFTIQKEKATVTYKKTDKDKVMFSPGDFSGLKVLTLKNPNRLVIDVYQDVKKGEKKNGADLKPASDRIIVIDSGHGGFESGIVKDDYAEKNIVLDIARKLSALAEQGSFKSFLTRSGDLFMSQSERVKYTNGKDADIFISLHIGHHKDIVIYIPVITEQVSDTVKPYLYNKGQEEYLKKTVILLNSLKEAATTNLGSEAVMVRPLPYSVLSKVEAAALMIELPSFEYANYSEEFKTAIANFLNKGLYLYEENETK
ncbi:MAG: N-acetylmuramoyl-L-alanine amidase [Nitrospirae bacterium]|nr:N-acetylmuramoyl-L-alanine amidase [Nitrospirota bacterium]